MGATDWRYYTPYTPNPRDALKRLRQEIFVSGQYQQPSSWSEDVDRAIELAKNSYMAHSLPPDYVANLERSKRIMSAVESGVTTGLSDADITDVAQIQRLMQASESFPSLHSGMLRDKLNAKKPKTIAALVRRAGESGTHSILDISKIAKQPGYGAAWPMSDQELLKAFGTAKPTRNDVEHSELTFWEQLERWQARYFVIYADGEPAEYAFLGSSGD